MSKIHMVAQILAVFLLTIGGAAAYMTKNAYGKDHFTSSHSWLAGVTVAITMLNMVGGLTTTFSGTKTSWQWKDASHRIGGTVAFLCGGVSVILGVYSGNWGNSHLGEHIQFKVASSVAAAYVLLLFKLVASSFAPATVKKID